MANTRWLRDQKKKRKEKKGKRKKSKQQDEEKEEKEKEEKNKECQIQTFGDQTGTPETALGAVGDYAANDNNFTQTRVSFLLADV